MLVYLYLIAFLFLFPLLRFDWFLWFLCFVFLRVTIYPTIIVSYYPTIILIIMINTSNSTNMDQRVRSRVKLALALD